MPTSIIVLFALQLVGRTLGARHEVRGGGRLAQHILQ
jgi:hypothetical protein